MKKMKQTKLCFTRITTKRDRISDLPDNVLHRILSYLDTKYVVRTSVLSKRWENVWIFTPFLNFSYNFSEYADPLHLPAQPYNKLYDQKMETFKNLITEVLKARNGVDIERISVCCDLILDSKFMNWVVSYAVKHKAKEIEIMADSSDLDHFEFPECVYTSRSLEKFKLVVDQYDCMYVSKTLPFQWLKELRLHRVYFTRRGINEEIFPRCPMLQHLSLVACDLGGNKTVIISAPRLKKFEMIIPLSEKNMPITYKVLISAHMLEYFKYEGPYPMDFSLDDCTPCLEGIDIDVQADTSDEYDIRKKGIMRRLIDMLRVFGNSKSVIISSRFSLKYSVC